MCNFPLQAPPPPPTVRGRRPARARARAAARAAAADRAAPRPAMTVVLVASVKSNVEDLGAEYDEHGLLVPLLLLALAGWASVRGLCGLPALVRGVRRRWARWELLHAPLRRLDLSPLGLERTLVLRQSFTGRCAPGAGADELGTGGALWGGALELSSWLLHGGAERLRGARCVELGAGLGLTSMVAALAPAGGAPRELLLTDGHPPVVEAARQHVADNLTPTEVETVQLAVMCYPWGDEAGTEAVSSFGSGGAYDLILAADVV
jgi:hypothetical protein